MRARGPAICAAGCGETRFLRMKALETLARCGLRGWCGRTARAAGAGTRLPRQERARAAGLLTGRGEHSSCGIRRCLPQAAFLAPGCSIIRASLPFANIGVLRAGRAQPLYLLTPAGRFALRATAHRADASLRRAHGFAALANIGVLCAGRAQPLYLLTPAGRFALRATAHRADASLRAARALATLAPSALRSPQRRPMPQRAVKGQGPFDISERRPSPYRAQRGRPLTAAERANQHRAYQHERSTKTPCSN